MDKRNLSCKRRVFFVGTMWVYMLNIKRLVKSQNNNTVYTLSNCRIGPVIYISAGKSNRYSVAVLTI